MTPQPRPIEAYASATSVSPSETIRFHISISPGNGNTPFQIDIWRKGIGDILVHSGSGTAQFHETPKDASEAGCGWPSAYELYIPDDWSSGVYEVLLTTGAGLTVATTKIVFVVKAFKPGRNSKILMQLTVNTYQAYNNWGGKSLYGDHPDVGADKVSFNRPEAGQGKATFYEYEYDFIKWIESNGFTIEYCTNIDLHTDPLFLYNYQLLLSVGHDEYWSKEMRDSVETFIGNGGNVAFFGGNTCWWQVRFEDSNRTMVCYKDKRDPIVPRILCTTKWRADPVNRPENSLTGVSYAHGAVWTDSMGQRPAIDYLVRRSQHWVFEGTGLNNNNVFGKEDLIIGYETDAALFVETNGSLQFTGKDCTPLNFIALATADLPGWCKGDETPEPPVGRATMGIYTRNNGTVFTAATTDWSHGLRDGWNAVSQITYNVLKRLSWSLLHIPMDNLGS